MEIKTKKSQAMKYHLAMAGEYFVAAQLQRLQVFASVTYGNAKSADVIAFTKDSDRVVVIEVKTTQNPKWVVGGRIPEKSNKPWVFVSLNEDTEVSPEFFILTQEELHLLLAPLEKEYFRKYLEKHGVEYGDKPGVVNISRSMLEPYKNCWSVIKDQLVSRLETK